MTKKEHILFGRLGNKTNDIKFFKHLLPLDIKNVVEPFGGTFAVIKNIYHDDKYKKYVNDTDPALFEIYTKPEKYSEMSMDLNEIAKKNKYEGHTSVNYKKFIEEAEKKYSGIMFDYWKKEKIIRGSFVKLLKTNVSHNAQLELMKKIKFSKEDYMTIINEHKYNKDTFIFLDPPYLFSNNKQYENQHEYGDCTDIIANILDVFKDKKTKAKIMLIVNDLKILRYLFKDYIKGNYEIIYQIAKKKDKHIIITNYIPFLVS